MTQGAPAPPQPFPWDRAMGFGFGVLRLSPDAFWRMTPRELGAAIRALSPPQTAAIGRGTLDALMRRFPDGSDNKVERRHGGRRQ